MDDWQARSYSKRIRLMNLAQSQIGAHYLLGATGAIPDTSTPMVWYYQTRVGMFPNTFHRLRPVLYAARTQLRGPDNICAGRSGLYPNGQAMRPRINPVPNNTAELQRAGEPDGFLWPRPSQTVNGPIVYGEACMGKRHFDCVHFVNWCLSNVFGRPIQKSIDQWFEASRHVFPGTPDPMIARLGTGGAAIWAGDIEISRANGHIGLLTGSVVTPQQHMVHAQSTEFGVRQTPFNPSSRAFGSHEASVRRILLFLEEDLAV